MIASFMMYAVIAAALITLAAISLEHFFIARAWPRRGIWIVAIFASIGLPALMAGLSSLPSLDRLADLVRIAEPHQGIQPGLASSPYFSGRATRSLAPSRTFAWPTIPSIDAELKYVWVAMSLGLPIVYVAGWIRMRRSLRRRPTEMLLGQSVVVSEDIGPAVLGFVKPIVIVPRWLLSAPETTRSSVMAHESEHIAARDPLCLLFALALIALMPWNLVLWWQLKRLRFAIEVDCDARVIRHNVDVLVYSETLLAVGQRGVRSLAGAITLTETVTQLERRIEIMTIQRRPYSTLVLSAVVGMSVACCAVAAELQAPNPFATLRLAQAQAGQRSAVLNDPFTLRLKDADIRDVLLLLEGFDEHKVYINSTIGGKVSLEFNNAPRKESLDILMRRFNLIRRQDADTVYFDPAPASPSAVKTNHTGEHLNIHFSNVSIREILRTLSDLSHQNMVVAKDVEFTTSVDFKDTPWDEALDTILKSNNLTSRRAGNLIIVEKATATIR